MNIFTEDEAVYNFTILRKRDEHVDETYDEVVLDELFTKSKRTVEVLSEILLLSKNQVFADGDIIESMQHSPAAQSIVLWSSTYQQVNITTVIKLLLRCKKLY